MRELKPGQIVSARRDSHRAFYKKYISSSAWFSRRVEWAETEKQARGELICYGCGSEWKVSRDDLHHASYARLGDEQHDDLWPLCRTCHDMLHQRMESSYTLRRMDREQAGRIALQMVQQERWHPET